MSDARWRSFFLDVARADLRLEYSEWRYASDDYAGVNRMPYENDLREVCFTDGYFQPFEYRYIKQILVPRIHKPYPGVGLVREQDVNGLVEALERTGKKSPFEVDEQGLRIFGYK